MKTKRNTIARIAVFPISIMVILIGCLICPMLIAMNWAIERGVKEYQIEEAASDYFRELFSIL
jgi:hypothetical protein